MTDPLPPKPPARAGRWLLVLLVLLLALGLRAWSLSWGAPNAQRFYLYHPDEPVLLDAVCGLNPLWGDFEPGVFDGGFYNYGSFYPMLCRLGYDFSAPARGWGSMPRFDRPFAEWVGDFAHLLMLGRWLTVLLGVACVLVVYLLGERLYSRRAGLLAAVFLAVAPAPVLLGHYMTVDVPSTSLAMLALLFAAAALDADPDRVRLGWVVGAGIAAGLATGTKYSCLPSILAISVPLWTAAREKRAWLPPLVLGLLAFIAAFLVSTPGVILDTAGFLKDVQQELKRNREGQGLLFIHTPPTAIYHLWISLPISLEWPLYLLSLAGLVYGLRKRRPGDILLLTLLVPTFVMLLPAERKFVRYVMPLLPIAALLAARLVDEGLATARGKGWSAAAAGLAGAAALASTVAHLGVITARDARDQAAGYVQAHAGPKDVVALGGDAWTYTPPLDRTAACVKYSLLYGGPPVWDAVPDGARRPDLCPLPGKYVVLAPRSEPTPAGALEIAKLEQYRPRYVILTDYDWEDPQRIHRKDPTWQNGFLELMDALDRDGYRVEREFRPRPSLGPFTWWSRGTPPHDWRYVMPTIRVYARPEAG